MSLSTAHIIHVGVDVHKDSVTIAVLPRAPKTLTHAERLPNDIQRL